MFTSVERVNEYSNLQDENIINNNNIDPNQKTYSTYEIKNIQVVQEISNLAKNNISIKNL